MKVLFIHCLRFAHALCLILFGVLTAAPASAQTWISEVDRSVVKILVGSQNTVEGLGSGWVVARGGYIVTNHHVVDGRDRQVVVYRDAKGRTQSAEARVVAQSEKHDLVILKIANVDLPPLLTSTTLPAKGSDVFAIGFPGAAEFTEYNDENGQVESTVTSGKVGRIIEGQLFGFEDAQGYAKTTWVQHSAAISGGSSGGPLFDTCGRVIAINTAGALGQLDNENGTIDAPQGIQFAAPIKNILPLINEISGTVQIENQTSLCTGQFAGATVAPTAAVPTDSGSYWPIVAILFLSVGGVFGIAVLLRKARTNGSLAVTNRRMAIAEKTPEPDDVWLLKGVTKAGAPVFLEALSGRRVTIGRGVGAGIHNIEDPTVSRRHAALEFGRSEVTLRDLGSSNGTLLDGQSVGSSSVNARPGQVLRVGGVSLLIGKMESKSRKDVH